MNTAIEVTNAISPATRELVLRGLSAFNAGQSDKMHSEPFAVVARRGEEVLGGLIGRTFAAWLSIDLFWLPEEFRGSGLGAAVLRCAENEARQRGCAGVHLDTFSFQAPGFYQRFGYSVFGALKGMPPGHERLFFQKRLVSPNALD
jgi:predicted N-acetyltransferase YhbS